MGVPVFLADIKGDLSGMCQPGQENKHIRRSIDNMGLDAFGYGYNSYPVRFFDVYGKKGHPVRTTIFTTSTRVYTSKFDINCTS